MDIHSKEGSQFYKEPNSRWQWLQEALSKGNQTSFSSKLTDEEQVLLRQEWDDAEYAENQVRQKPHAHPSFLFLSDNS